MALPAYEIALIVLACLAGLLAVIVITVLIILCCLRWRRLDKQIARRDGETQTMEHRWRFSLASLRGRKGSQGVEERERRNRSYLESIEIERQPSFGNLPPLNEDDTSIPAGSQRRRGDPPPYNYPHRTVEVDQTQTGVYETSEDVTEITTETETKEIFTTDNFQQSTSSDDNYRQPPSKLTTEGFQTSSAMESSQDDNSGMIVLNDVPSGAPVYFGDSVQEPRYEDDEDVTLRGAYPSPGYFGDSSVQDPRYEAEEDVTLREAYPSPGYFGDSSVQEPRYEAEEDVTLRAYPARVVPAPDLLGGSSPNDDIFVVSDPQPQHPYLVQDEQWTDDRFFVRLSMSVDELGRDRTRVTSGKVEKLTEV